LASLAGTSINSLLRTSRPTFGLAFQAGGVREREGAGEPVFEFDFPPGSDITGEIMSGPRAGERMESE
jgi:hypothetical protein